MQGPLAGIKVLEAGGIGPVPFCGMVLSDLGAEVVQVVREHDAPIDPADVPARGRHRLHLDLRSEGGRNTALALAGAADVLLEGFRPGVMERLGIGPEACLSRNPRLVYGRMTGWGQTGPLASEPGHDLNYLALSGALHAMGEPGEPPPVPLNLVADYGGGAMLLTVGVLAALQERNRSGRGQVVDSAMAEGSSLLSSLFYGRHAAGRWGGRGTNHLDGGAHFYNTYLCADGKFVAVAATEAQFYAQFIALLGVDSDAEFAGQWDRSRWSKLKARTAALILARGRDEWCALAQGRNACISPVLDFDEAPAHAQHVARGAFVQVDGVTQPGCAPRFSRTPGKTPQAARMAGAALLRDWGLPPEAIGALLRAQAG